MRIDGIIYSMKKISFIFDGYCASKRFNNFDE